MQYLQRVAIGVLRWDYARASADQLCQIEPFFVPHSVSRNLHLMYCIYCTAPYRPCRYTDYILDTLAKRELFQWLSLSPAKFWHTLLLKDR
jgi:hypothetical protein